MGFRKRNIELKLNYDNSNTQPRRGVEVNYVSFLALSGSVLEPSYSFVDSTNSGLFLSGNDSNPYVKMSCSGTIAVVWDKNGNTDIKNNLSLSGAFETTSTGLFNSDLTVSGNFGVTGTALIGGKTTLSDELVVVSTVSITGAFEAVSTGLFNSSLTVSGNFETTETGLFNADLTVTGAFGVTGQGSVLGSFGIGTASPAKSLHLNTSDPSIRLQDTGGGDVFEVANVDGAFRIYNQTDERADIYIDGDGNVGFDTSSPTEKLDVNGDSIRLRTSQTPTNGLGGSGGSTGQIAWDSNYIYVCVSTDTWKRVALSAF